MYAIRSYYGEILRMREDLNKILARHTGQDIDTIARDTERDNFMGPDEACAYGLIDKVIKNREVIEEEKKHG